jgi:hypothetical protein
MTETQTRIESKAVARVSTKPQLARTGPGFPVCRFTVVTDEGSARNPVIKPVYVFGGPGELERRLALRCERLRVGELVQVTGLERQRVRRTKGKAGKRWYESSLQAMDVLVLGDDGHPVKRSDESERLLKGLVVHCMKSPYEIYIGRGKDPDTDERGEWGNMYSHRESHFERVIYVDTAEEAVACYKAELWESIKSGQLSLERLASLAGKTLGCWCAPSCCHGDVLAGASIWAVEELARQRSAC